MPKFGKLSLERLSTVHPDLQKVMNEAIKHYDFTVLFGHRTKEEQFELFKKGRKQVDGKWVKAGAVVTNLDGYNKMSMHNHSPSLAIDIAPYPIDWTNKKRFNEMAKVVKEAAKTVGVDITWGGDWTKFSDLPHFELKQKDK